MRLLRRVYSIFFNLIFDLFPELSLEAIRFFGFVDFTKIGSERNLSHLFISIKDGFSELFDGFEKA